MTSFHSMSVHGFDRSVLSRNISSYNLSCSSVGGSSLQNKDTVAYEQELAVVAYYLQSWRPYFKGCPGGVTMVTVHQPLLRLIDQQVLTKVQMRWLWLGLFQSICPTIKYQSGKANLVADALSQS